MSASLLSPRAARLVLACSLFASLPACEPDSSSQSADVVAKNAKFKLKPGVEDVASCAPRDRACYLGEVDLQNAFWLGAVSKSIYALKVDPSQPAGVFGAMTSKDSGLILPEWKGGLRENGLTTRELAVFDDSLARSTAMYFETKTGIAVLAFRGTANDEGPANLFADANVKQTCTKDAGVEYCIHSGFRENFYHLWSSKAEWARYVPMTFCADGTDAACDTAKEKVVVRVELGAYLRERFAGPNAPKALFITGHSLGGALATLALNELLVDPTIVPASVDVAVYTFGTPRVGNEAFALEVFDASRKRGIPYYRFVHRQDGVARVKVDKYAHLGDNPVGEGDGLDTLIHLVGANERNGKGPIVTLGDYDAEDPGSAADMIKDHDMSKYMPLLKIAKLP